MRTIVHVTHEAVQKVGGIGAVLEGLLTSDAYRQRDHRTILVGPMTLDGTGARGRLGSHGKVLYSSADHVAHDPAGRALDHVCQDYGVDIVYGRRTFTNPHTRAPLSPEIVLIDVTRMHRDRVNGFKARLWEHYGIDSRRYEQAPDYELYVRLAEPALAAVRALGGADFDDECIVCAHEFMGLPTALAARLDPGDGFRTIFYAHEVSAIRRIVEELPAHDLAFYNVLPEAMERHRYIDDVFGRQDDYYRHALVLAAAHCDLIFAVGHHVERELRFLSPELAEADIWRTYNGIPVERIGLGDKHASKRRLQDYAATLLGDRPDYIFSHVTRTSVSKALWRDFRVLEQLERAFRRTGTTAVLFILSVEGCPRRPEDIRAMERWWNWPVTHREVSPDLTPGEALVHQGVQELNARCRQIKAVYVNQFGFDQQVCGDRMPGDMQFMDLRRGTDVEFGMSIYEPFGISHLEPLTFGGICVVSSACGCVSFIDDVADGEPAPNVLVADYCDLPDDPDEERSPLTLTRDERDRHERRVAEDVARRLYDVLPRDDATAQSLLRRGCELAGRMSWEVVAGRYILPAIDAACDPDRQVRVA